MLHVHVLLIAPLGTGHMVQPGANQHKSRVPVWEGPDYTRTAAEIPVETLNHIVGSDPGPVLIGEVTVCQRLINTVFHLLSRLFQLHRFQFGNYGLGLFVDGPLALRLLGKGAAHSSVTNLRKHVFRFCTGAGIPLASPGESQGAPGFFQ